MKISLIILLLCALLSCAKNNIQRDNSELRIIESDSQVANFMANNPPGTTAFFDITPLGSPAEIMITNKYISALGQQCTTARASNATTQLIIAACNSTTGIQLIPAIYESILK